MYVAWDAEGRGGAGFKTDEEGFGAEVVLELVAEFFEAEGEAAGEGGGEDFVETSGVETGEVGGFGEGFGSAAGEEVDGALAGGDLAFFGVAAGLFCELFDEFLEMEAGEGV